MQFSTPIILASSSPRRADLLRQVAITHYQMSADIDETRLADETPVCYIERMVAQKANKALQLLNQPSMLAFNSSQYLLITADTIGVLPNGDVLQKPNDFHHACEMWRQMSKNTHQVWTAIQVSKLSGNPHDLTMLQYERQTIKTDVEFIQLTEEMMSDYWQTGEPQDKAGAYAIQGIGASWVKAIHGSYSNVVGLPIVESIELLKILDKD